MLRTAIAGFVGVLVGAAVVGVATSQQKELTAKVVRAERFEVVDAKGEVPAVLAVREDGTPYLALFDADEEVRAILAVLPSATPDLYLCDADGKPRASLAVWEDGPSLRLRDAKGKDRAVLGTTSTKTIKTGVVHQRPESSLVLLDKDGEVLWSAP